MSEPTNQELKELILLSVSELEKKMDVGFESVRGEIKEVSGEIKRLDEKIEGQVARLEEKINGLDKGLSNSEVVSRTAFIAVVGGMAAGLIKLFFFPGNP
ncbi:MAG: Bdr protein [Xenococcaceae cyanobacterium]